MQCTQQNILSLVLLQSITSSADKRNGGAYPDTSVFQLLKFYEASCDSTHCPHNPEKEQDLGNNKREVNRHYQIITKGYW